MRLVVGLGNPGERYRRTRHNVGFMVVDVLAARGAKSRWSLEADAAVAEAELGGETVLLLKPQTFMNRSGLAVQRLLLREGGAPSDVITILDDVALELGTLRIRERGSHGGHNGLRSLIEVLGSEEIPRVRVGIRKGEEPEALADYVLSAFPEEDVLAVQDLVGWAADGIECVLREGVSAAMNRWNGVRSAGAP
jgi:PTH1 family peptidyl-tRNA hydrolase